MGEEATPSLVPVAETAEDSDQIATAVAETVAEIIQYETEWDDTKIEKHIRQYIRKSAKKLAFGQQPWQELVNEFADNFFASIFLVFSERTWLAYADFFVVVDA